MSKKLITALFGFSLLGFIACEQNFTDTETNKSVVKPNQTELAKSYSYSKVNVRKGFENQATFLTMDDPTKANNNFNPAFLSSNIKEGDVVEIRSVTDSKAKLGRVLFYDQKLSLNNAISCGSCHHQAKGFADGLAVSPGFEGRNTTRNSMAIVNPAMSHSGLFWDRRENSVLDMSLRPVTNHIEMGMEDLTLLERKLAVIDYYPALFSEAYNTPVITKARISEAISAFVRSMVSWDSKFDQGRVNNFQDFTYEEKRGMEIFAGNTFTTDPKDFFSTRDGACNTCHNAPMFNDGVNRFGGSSYDGGDVNDNNISGVNIGLDKVSKDKGIKNGTFKIPSLRNVELTAPYMHDGRFSTLEDVVTHYNEKVQSSLNLHRNLRDTDGTPKRLKLTPADQKALVAFLKTLTDKKFISDPKFSDPFKM